MAVGYFRHDGSRRALFSCVIGLAFKLIFSLRRQRARLNPWTCQRRRHLLCSGDGTKRCANAFVLTYLTNYGLVLLAVACPAHTTTAPTQKRPDILTSLHLRLGLTPAMDCGAFSSLGGYIWQSLCLVVLAVTAYLGTARVRQSVFPPLGSPLVTNSVQGTGA
jgi:hypothetical protein